MERGNLSEEVFVLRYGDREISFSLPDCRVLGELKPNKIPGVLDPKGAVREALENPTDAPPLRELLSPTSKIAITVSDVTRVTRSEIVVPIIVEELNKGGVPDDNITIIFAVGSHRQLTEEEHRRLIGDEIADRIKHYNHNCLDEDNLTYKGETSRGVPVYINSIVANADVKIITGAVNYHDFAGYSGGCKGVVPGVSRNETIQRNHLLMFNPRPKKGFNPNASMGILEGNPTREDMEEATKLGVPDAFLVNVVLNSDYELVKVVAGDIVTAHREGCKVIDQMFSAPVKEMADLLIVSSGGYPKDISFYQASKPFNSIANIIKPGGVMILLAECREGLGSSLFASWFAKGSADELEEALRSDFHIVGQVAYRLLFMLGKFKLILVADKIDDLLLKAGVEPTSSLEEALTKARKILPDNPKTYVVPQGNITFCYVDKQSALG